MQRFEEGKLLSFVDVNTNAVQSLFESEGYFWLTTAVATGFAAEELDGIFPSKQMTAESGEIVSLFNQCIREGIKEQAMQQAKQWSLENISRINQCNHQSMIFQINKSTAISKSFTSYWLIYKLIELEWQEVLGRDEINETYQFLDGVLADSQELEEIEQKQARQEVLDDDQKIFLRSHWERAKLFWDNLHGNLNLYAMGLLQRQQKNTV